MAGAFLMLIYGKEERMAGLILWVMNMIYQERYVYYIKDEYFEKVQDSKLHAEQRGRYTSSYIIVIRNVPNVSSTIPATDFW